MDSTPRLRSRFPTTPNTPQNHTISSKSSSNYEGSNNCGKTQGSAIPFEVVDAPSQRLYVSLIYLALMLWRIFDYYNLPSDGADGFLYFTKWVGIDTAFLYGLSGLKIPWLQWSASTFTVLFAFHGLLDWILMFQIPIPLLPWLGGLTKVIYDRELAVSERRVKPASILRNSSLILGKQIINILPEGYAMINPQNHPFCVSSSKAWVDLPIQVNQSTPIHIELLRIDIETNEQEVVEVPKRDIKRMKKHTENESRSATTVSAVNFSAKKTGWYRLQRVTDETHLDVQIRTSSAIVVRCPKASVRKVAGHKCKGELSDFGFVVEATPPIKLRYSKLVNGDDQGHTTLYVQPDHYSAGTSEIRGFGVSQSLLEKMDASWARQWKFQVPLNESLGVAGGWQYILHDVSDALGNIANFSKHRFHESSWQKPSEKLTEQHFLVHERAKVSIRDYDTQHPLKVESGKSTLLPIRFGPAESSLHSEGPFSVSYLFTPADHVLPDQTHPEMAEIKQTTMRSAETGMDIRQPGLYTLTSISSRYCKGEVLEPSTCMLENPPEPDLSITTEPIPDKCAGNSIGLIVNFDPTGTPPFKLHYTVRKRGGQITAQQMDIGRMHTRLEFKPPDTGHYTYEFTQISDSVYRKPRSLLHKSLVVDQDIKAPPSADILEADYPRKACLDEQAEVYVQMTGEPPFWLSYELVHRGKRTKYEKADIEDNFFKLETEPLHAGGGYILVLTSLTDQSGCKTTLQAEAKIDVSLQRPRAAFGTIDSQQTLSALEGRKITLPLRLQGESPWTLYYRRLEDPGAINPPLIIHHSNDQMEVRAQGTYELTDVRDRSCPGNVDHASHRFSVKWISRPYLTVAESSTVERNLGRFVKKEVCQDDEDALGISFTGTPPFNFEFDHRSKPISGSQSMFTKKITSGQRKSSLEMETHEAGLHEYRITRLSDASYNFDQRRFSPVLIEQRIHARPFASFVEAGKIYRYCQDEESGSDVIPIRLTGQAPFQLELEIKHQAVSRPEIISFPHIETPLYNLQLPRRLRRLGSHTVAIRKVQDSRGCQRHMDRSGTTQVSVRIAELPSISPLEGERDYCIGDHVSFALSGTPPFNVFYTFQNRERKASVPGTSFRRIADKPGEFVINSISDRRSTDACKARTELVKVIHEMPSARISKGRISTVDIREGGEAAILFEFGGMPPFHFTFTRSAMPSKGKKMEVLETRNEVSHDYSKSINASAEGVYEVVSIRDRFCSFSKLRGKEGKGQKLLSND